MRRKSKNRRSIVGIGLIVALAVFAYVYSTGTLEFAVIGASMPNCIMVSEKGCISSSDSGGFENVAKNGNIIIIPDSGDYQAISTSTEKATLYKTIGKRGYYVWKPKPCWSSNNTQYTYVTLWSSQLSTEGGDYPMDENDIYVGVVNTVPQESIQSYCFIEAPKINYEKSKCTVKGIVRVEYDQCPQIKIEVSETGNVINYNNKLACSLPDGMKNVMVRAVCGSKIHTDKLSKFTVRYFPREGDYYTVNFDISTEPEKEPDEPAPSEPEEEEPPDTITCETYGYTTTAPSCTSGTPLKIKIDNLQCYDGCSIIIEPQKANCGDYGYTLEAPFCLYGIKTVQVGSIVCYDGCKPAPTGGWTPSTESVTMDYDYTWLIILGIIVFFAVIGIFALKPKRSYAPKRRR